MSPLRSQRISSSAFTKTFIPAWVPIRSLNFHPTQNIDYSFNVEDSRIGSYRVGFSYRDAVLGRRKNISRFTMCRNLRRNGENGITLL